MAGVDSFTASLRALGDVPGARAEAAQAAFRQARRAYKRVEYLVAELLPEAELTLNGPPLPHPSELVVEATLPPTGLQVIEAALFPEPAANADSIIRHQLRLLAPTLASLRTVRIDPATADARVFDAARQEIARVTTLGLAGFDATVTGDGVTESAEALLGVRSGLAAYGRTERGPVRAAWEALDSRLGGAVAALDRSPAFDTFDRFEFITAQAAPLASALTRLQAALGVPRTARPTVWYASRSSIFEPAALDPFDYAPSDAVPLRPDIVALGRRLFFDSRLSVRWSAVLRHVSPA